MLNLDVTAFLHFADGVRHGESRGQVEDRIFRELGIDHGVAVGHRTGERVPAGVDVLENRYEAGGGFCASRAASGAQSEAVITIQVSERKSRRRALSNFIRQKDRSG